MATEAQAVRHRRSICLLGSCCSSRPKACCLLRPQVDKRKLDASLCYSAWKPREHPRLLIPLQQVRAATLCVGP